MSSDKEIQQVFEELVGEDLNKGVEVASKAERASVALAFIGGASLLRSEVEDLYKKHEIIMAIVEQLCESLGIDINLVEVLDLPPIDLNMDQILKAEDTLIKALTQTISGDDDNANTQ